MSDRIPVYGFHALLARMRHRADSIQQILVDRKRRDPRLKRLLAVAGEKDRP